MPAVVLRLFWGPGTVECEVYIERERERALSLVPSSCRIPPMHQIIWGPCARGLAQSPEASRKKRESEREREVKKRSVPKVFVPPRFSRLRGAFQKHTEAACPSAGPDG